MKQLFGIKFNEFFIIILGSLLLAVGIYYVSAPINLVTGGVSGLSIIILKLSGDFGFKIPIFVSTIVLNIPLFAVSVKQRGIGFIKKSVLSVGCLSLALFIMEFFKRPFDITNDILLSAIIYGLMSGLGIGLVLRCLGTTGGTDMLAAVIKFKRPNYKTANLMLVIDYVIIIFSIFVFGIGVEIYAFVAIIIQSIFITRTLDGGYSSKAAFIFSDKYLEISEKILYELKRGNTAFHCTGMYTKKETEMLYVVVDNKEIALLIKLVKKIDPKAFMTVSDVKDVLGEGFIEDYIEDKL